MPYSAEIYQLSSKLCIFKCEKKVGRISNLLKFSFTSFVCGKKQPNLQWKTRLIMCRKYLAHSVIKRIFLLGHHLHNWIFSLIYYKITWPKCTLFEPFRHLSPLFFKYKSHFEQIISVNSFICLRLSIYLSA